MKLEDYKKLIEIQLLTENGLQNILESKKAYENNEIDKEFNNAKLFKSITESNKELIDRIEKKTDQSDELIKHFSNALPLYNQQAQAQAQAQVQAETKEEPQTIIDNENKIINSKDFIGDLIKGKNVFLHTGKKGDIYTNVKLRNLDELDKLTKKDLELYLKSGEIKSLTQQLYATNQWHPNVKSIKSYIKDFKEYKEKVNKKILEKDSLSVIKEDKILESKTQDNGNDVVKDKILESKTQDNANDVVKDKISENHTQHVKEEVKGQGIKKRRNSYKIENAKYGDILKINMDKLYNNYYVEAWYGDNILYENQGDKDTVELLSKSRINNKKKYTELSKQIFNDMMMLSGMVKKRNGKNKLLKGESNIILNDSDRKKRISLIRGSIIAGNDNKKLAKELSVLTNQENVTQNKSITDLYNDLKILTPILKTSEGDENVHNQVYNIIDYLRTNRHISRDQYHKYIKKHLM